MTIPLKNFMIRYLRKTANNIYSLMRGQLRDLPWQKKNKAMIVQSKLADL